jgi:hypothetical protein
MSTMANEVLLETYFEEAMEELIKQNFHLMFNQENLERVAFNLAKEHFEDNQ